MGARTEDMGVLGAEQPDGIAVSTREGTNGCAVRSILADVWILRLVLARSRATAVSDCIRFPNLQQSA